MLALYLAFISVVSILNLIVIYLLYTFPVATFDPDSKFISNVLSRLEAMMGVHIVSVLADIHYQLTTTSGVQLQSQLVDVNGDEIELPDPQTAPGQYVEMVMFQWSAGRSPRPPTWSELLQVLQDIGQLELRQQIEVFMDGMCTDMHTSIVTNFIFSFASKNGQFLLIPYL